MKSAKIGLNADEIRQDEVPKLLAEITPGDIFHKALALADAETSA